MNETWWVTKDQLIGEQLNVIDLALDGDYLILGPPGSGKTNLLLLRANYEFLAGHENLSIIVFTRTLQEFLRAGAHQYDFPPEKIFTSTRWLIELLRMHGVSVPKEQNFSAMRTALLGAAKDLIEKKDLSGTCGVILLDEAQDYSLDEVEVFSKLAERLFVVADSRQQIYSQADALHFIKSKVDEVHVLKHHFRNGLAICRLADNIAKSVNGYVSMESTSHYDEVSRPSTVEIHKADTLDEQISRMLEKLGVQRKAYPDELLGVCCPKKDDVSKVWAAIEKSDFSTVATVQNEENDCQFEASTRICVATVHAAKGLEFRALHLVGLEQLGKFSLNVNLAFTGVTRSKTSLSLYYSSSIPTFLSDAIKKLQPPPPLPPIAAVFGKKK